MRLLEEVAATHRDMARILRRQATDGVSPYRDMDEEHLRILGELAEMGMNLDRSLQRQVKARDAVEARAPVAEAGLVRRSRTLN